MRMNVRYKFTIEAQPIPLKRHRQGRYGNYDPHKKAKSTFLLVCLSMARWSSSIMRGNIFIHLEFYCVMPKNWSKKKKDEMEGKHRNKRPDLDNYIKFVLDSLQGTFFSDDSQIVELNAYKYYSQTPRTEISIMEIDE